MLNPELSQVVNAQINKIFIEAYPAEARFVECNNLIDKAKLALINNSELKYNLPNLDSKTHASISTMIKDEESIYEISYHRATSAHSVKERFTVLKNNSEKIKLLSLIYSDGKRNAFIEFFNDRPDFTKLNSTNFEYNKKHAEEIIFKLVHLLSKPQ